MSTELAKQYVTEHPGLLSHESSQSCSARKSCDDKGMHRVWTINNFMLIKRKDMSSHRMFGVLTTRGLSGASRLIRVLRCQIDGEMNNCLVEIQQGDCSFHRASIPFNSFITRTCYQYIKGFYTLQAHDTPFTLPPPSSGPASSSTRAILSQQCSQMR